MVLQMADRARTHQFVASSETDSARSETEIAGWAAAHGYRAPRFDRVFAVYKHGQLIREWTLLEPRAAARCAPLL